MEKELLKKGELSLEIVNGDFVLVFDSKGVDVSLKVESAYFLDLLKEKIPGSIDDVIIETIKGALKAA